VVSFMMRALYRRGKSPRYSLDRRLAGPQSQSGSRGDDCYNCFVKSVARIRLVKTEKTQRVLMICEVCISAMEL
jgi:hypothetical protein